jgi:hypothetical protein
MLKNADFWDVAPCRSCVNRRFGGTCRLHLQGRKIRSENLKSYKRKGCRKKEVTGDASSFGRFKGETVLEEEKEEEEDDDDDDDEEEKKKKKKRWWWFEFLTAFWNVTPFILVY